MYSRNAPVVWVDWTLQQIQLFSCRLLKSGIVRVVKMRKLTFPDVFNPVATVEASSALMAKMQIIMYLIFAQSVVGDMAIAENLCVQRRKRRFDRTSEDARLYYHIWNFAGGSNIVVTFFKSPCQPATNWTIALRSASAVSSPHRDKRNITTILISKSLSHACYQGRHAHHVILNVVACLTYFRQTEHVVKLEMYHLSPS